MKIYKIICPKCPKTVVGQKEEQAVYYIRQHYLAKHKECEIPEIKATEIEV